jgi:hypothetical protein
MMIHADGARFEIGLGAESGKASGVYEAARGGGRLRWGWGSRELEFPHGEVINRGLEICNS